MSAFQLPQGAPLDEDLSTIAGLSPSNDDILQRKAGAWANRTAAQLKTDLALDKGDVGLGNVDNTSDATKNAATATLSGKTVQLAAGTGTGLNVWASGTFEVTGAGTLIPSIDQVTAAAAVVGIGSYFQCYRVGSTSVASVGQWD